jgi:repressor LexA
MLSIGEQIKAARVKAGVTQEGLAETVGCSKAHLSLMESGQRTVSPARVAQIENALGITDGRLAASLHWQNTPESVRERMTHSQELAAGLKRALAGKKPLAELRRLVERSSSNVEGMQRVAGLHGVPVINKVVAGYPTEFTDLDYPARVADEYVSCPDVSDPDAFAARVVGNSMEPEYREGDIVVFSPLLPMASGCDCFVRLDRDNETTFKRVYFEEEGGRIRLQPLNNAYAPRILDREAVAGLYAAVYVLRRVGKSGA